MANIKPLRREDLPEFEEVFALTEQFMGFVPNSMITMARVPGLLAGFQGLAGAVFTTDLISPELIQMVAFVSSAASGCRYCQAHTAKTLSSLGASDEKLEALWEFETSDHFDDGERTALRLAFHAGQVPNGATADHFADCRAYFDDDQIAAIVATISLFGYLNRWNDTMATDLEEGPNALAGRVLTGGGWQAGKHRHDG